jgi:hypothetical protein
MNKLRYGYHFYKGVLVIIPLLGGPSVYAHLDEVLTELKTEVPSFGRKHIICEGEDGYWDLVVPAGKRGLPKTQIYPLSVLTLEEAEVKLRKLIASSQYLRIFP